MVGNTRRTADTRRIRRLKTPRVLEVEACDDGMPRRLWIGGAWQEVAPVRRSWLLDQHWWRDDRIRRRYHRVALPDGPPLTIYEDLVTGEWFRQEY